MMNNRSTGPCYVPEEVLQALANQPLNHRSSDFSMLLIDTTNKLRKLVNAPSSPLLLTCSGTGALEATIASIVNVDSKVLVLSAGIYGDLLFNLAQHFSQYTEVVRFTYGEPITPEGVEKYCNERMSDYDVVLLTHSESSTGVYNPIGEIVKVIKHSSDALILVDSISSIGVTKIDMSCWGVDVIVGASQKGLMSPPGVSFVYLNDRVKEKVLSKRNHQKYMHLKPWLESFQKNTTPYTPAVNLVSALHTSLKMISAEGDLRFKRHASAAYLCQKEFINAGVDIFPTLAFSGNSITAIRLPDDILASSIKSELEQDFNILVSTGLGSLTQKILRIGHMGHFTLPEIKEVINSVNFLINKRKAKNNKY